MRLMMHKEIKKQVVEAIEDKVERDKIRGYRGNNSLIVDDYCEIDKKIFDEVVTGFTKIKHFTGCSG